MPLLFCNNDLLPKLSSWLQEKKPGSVFLLSDKNVAKLHLHQFSGLLDEPNTILLEADENLKTIDSCKLIWDRMLNAGADRNSLLINLGGGMVTDIGGFAAAVFKRGIPFIHIPTTLLSMVDAAAGGKTGVNYGYAKNQLGTFTQPEAIFMDPVFLKSLPPRQLLSGYAEVLKYGLIDSSAVWNKYSNTTPFEIEDWQNCIEQCIRIKDRVVAEDPFENGMRKALNFGHTIGHALESYSLENNAGPLTHGEAVAAGMLVEAFLSCHKGLLSQAEWDEIHERLKRLYPVYSFPAGGIPALIGLMKKDKKNRNGKIRFVLLERIGKCVCDFELNEEEIAGGLEFYRRLSE